MGSDSDFPVVRSALTELKKYGVEFECHIMSAHRTPAEAAAFASSAAENGFGVIICAAGMAAHLAGVIAGNTILPVIGIPMSSSVLDGMDALLATVMMPPGVPVATVAVNGAKNAAVLAVQILSRTVSFHGGLPMRNRKWLMPWRKKMPQFRRRSKMSDKKEKKAKRFVIKEEQDLGMGAVRIIVDTVTGVNYLGSGISPGITPLLDSSGNVVIDKITDK